MIVFDSSTIILLAKTELFDIFLEDYREKVLIPLEVEAESCSRKESFDALLVQKRIQEKKIGVAKVSNTDLCKQLMRDFNLGKGEAEAIALALESKAELIATDDKNALKACKLLTIPFTSAIAILVRLAEKKVIDKDKKRVVLDALLKHGRYSDTIAKEAREKLGL